jgi:hypothetical protein
MSTDKESQCRRLPVSLAEAARRRERAIALILQAQTAYNAGDIPRALELAEFALRQVPLHLIAPNGGSVH